MFEPFKPNQEELDSYVGDYTSSYYPKTISIIKNNKNIFTKINDESEFLIEPVEKNKFENLWEGKKLEFYPNNKEMIFEENGNKYTLNRK